MDGGVVQSSCRITPSYLVSAKRHTLHVGRRSAIFPVCDRGVFVLVLRIACSHEEVHRQAVHPKDGLPNENLKFSFLENFENLKLNGKRWWFGKMRIRSVRKRKTGIKMNAKEPNFVFS